MPQFKYWIVEHGMSIKSAQSFPSRYGNGYYLNDKYEYALHELAEEAAEHEHYNRGGWEYSFPLTFVLATSEDKELGRFIVERDAKPEFTAKPSPTIERME